VDLHAGIAELVPDQPPEHVGIEQVLPNPDRGGYRCGRQDVRASRLNLELEIVAEGEIVVRGRQTIVGRHGIEVLAVVQDGRSERFPEHHLRVAAVSCRLSAPRIVIAPMQAVLIDPAGRLE
jgi:hypothetical protein